VIDDATLALVPATLPLPADAATLTAVAAPENVRPLVPLLTVQGSSAIDVNTKQPVPTRMLLDGRGDTPWIAPAFSFATFRGTIPALPLERVDLDLRVTAGAQPPVELWLLGEAGKSLRVALPPGAQAVSVPLEPAWSSRCLAVVLGPGAQPGKPVALGEILAFGSVDRSGGADALVGQVVRDGAEAQVAGEVLAALGVAGARALAARFEELPLRQKRRALALFARALADEAVQARMLEAARSSEKELAEPALHLLSNAGAAGKTALRALALDGSSAGDAAAKLLARDPAETGALLAALAHGDNAARPELRRALAFLGQRHPAQLTTAIDGWLAQKPGVRAKVGLALALARVDALAPKVGELVALSLPEVQEFEDRYRLALTSPHAGQSQPLDGWLEQQALHADEWMMRHAAFAALETRLPARAGELAPALSRDAYPRVRALVLGTFSRTGRFQELEQVAKSDAWPLVRTAAIKGLTPHPESSAVLTAALEDTSRMVRAAAVDVLSTHKNASAWPAVRARLVAEGEWPVVRIAAVRFAAALCRQDAHDDLLALARGVARPDAAERDQELGLEALKAMNALGGKPAADARQIAAREGVPPGLKRALEEAGGSSCQAAPAVPQS
jgi:hypothetical protein